MDPDQIKIGMVVVVGGAMMGILVHAVVRASQRRFADRVSEARSLHVTVSLPVAATAEERADRWEDPLDDLLSAAGAGEVVTGRAVQRRGAPGGEVGHIEIGVRLIDGQGGMQALKTALRTIRAPAETALTWKVSGVEAKDRVGGARG